jgi:hypothetical protein
LRGRNPLVVVSFESYNVNDSLNRALDRMEKFERTGRADLLLYAALAEQFKASPMRKLSDVGIAL